jgi:tetratricopeptide (TPR) repeat protein
LRLEYRYDENQVLDVRLFHGERSDVKPFETKKEHPLTHIYNPQAVKLRIQKTEEHLRTGYIRPEQRREAIIELAEDCAELRHYEKAIARLSGLLQQQNAPDAFLINRMAIYYGHMGDTAREERLYTEASAADPTIGTPWFNLALLLMRQRRFTDAKHAIEMALGLEPQSGPYHVVHALIMRSMALIDEEREALEVAHKNFRSLAAQNDWELHWCRKLAECRDDQFTVAAVRQEQQRRNLTGREVEMQNVGLLPALAGAV